MANPITRLLDGMNELANRVMGRQTTAVPATLHAIPAQNGAAHSRDGYRHGEEPAGARLAPGMGEAPVWVTPILGEKPPAIKIEPAPPQTPISVDAVVTHFNLSPHAVRESTNRLTVLDRDRKVFSLALASLVAQLQNTPSDDTFVGQRGLSANASLAALPRQWVLATLKKLGIDVKLVDSEKVPGSHDVEITSSPIKLSSILAPGGVEVRPIMVGKHEYEIAGQKKTSAYTIDTQAVLTALDENPIPNETWETIKIPVTPIESGAPAGRPISLKKAITVFFELGRPFVQVDGHWYLVIK